MISGTIRPVNEYGCLRVGPPANTNNTLTWYVMDHALASKQGRHMPTSCWWPLPQPKTVFYGAVMEKVKESFSPGVAEELGYYVYRLIDPRDGQTFYIGRGQGNRVFDHVNEQEKLELNDRETHKTVKLEAIREIRRAGLHPTHIIHRHQLTEDVAKEVEAALIDATPGLKNVLKGKGVDRGPANAEQLNRLYSKKVIDFTLK